MSKPLKTVGIVLGAVALIATGVGAIAGAGLAIGGLSVATIGEIAGVAATAANIGATALAKPPPARGSVTQALFDPNSPTPYVMGEGYVAGALRYDVGYGGTVDKVVNPYRFQAWVYSGGGPVQSLTPYVDFAPVAGYYAGFLYTDAQLGACPEADALAPHWPGTPSWGAAYKLSGHAAIGWSFQFDKKGKVYASGLPVTGAYGQWVLVYDPRLDDTFPGGAGACRLGNEATYVWSENPALHAGTYAYGRYQNGKRVYGVGMPADGIDWGAVAAWANVCEANGWTIFGRIFEPTPQTRWPNLVDICMAGGGEPSFVGAVLSFRWSAPVVALDTITAADNAGDDDTVTAMQGYKDRLNTIIPKYTSAANNWEQVPAGMVQVATYLAEDGEERAEEWPFNLVKDVDQAAVLARYRLEDSRELHPIVLNCKPRLRGYRPGDCLHIDRPDMGLDHDAIILSRTIDPAKMTVTLTLISETPGKHAFALGMTGVPPATPALSQTGADADAVAGSLRGVHRFINPSVNFPLSSDDTSITVMAFDATLDNGSPISFPAGSITGLASGADWGVFYDLAAGTYSAVAWPAADEMAAAGLVFIERWATSTAGVYDDPEPPPPGYCVADDTPILLADGTEVPASEIVPGSVIRTQHAGTLATGDWLVAGVGFIDDQPVYVCELEGLNGPVTIRATARHRFLIEGRWKCAEDIGTPAGTARVAAFSVPGAQSYMSNGVLSHNIKAAETGV